jgi:hypothetical protein
MPMIHEYGLIGGSTHNKFFDNFDSARFAQNWREKEKARATHGPSLSEEKVGTSEARWQVQQTTQGSRPVSHSMTRWQA